MGVGSGRNDAKQDGNEMLEPSSRGEVVAARGELLVAPKAERSSESLLEEGVEAGEKQSGPKVSLP